MARQTLIGGKKPTRPTRYWDSKKKVWVRGSPFQVYKRKRIKKATDKKVIKWSRVVARTPSVLVADVARRKALRAKQMRQQGKKMTYGGKKAKAIPSSADRLKRKLAKDKIAKDKKLQKGRILKVSYKLPDGRKLTESEYQAWKANRSGATRKRAQLLRTPTKPPKKYKVY